MEKQEIMLGKEGIEFLRRYQIPVVKTLKIKNSRNLSRLKLPIVLKAISPKIVHKTKNRAIEIVYERNKLNLVYNRLKKLGYVIAQPYVKGSELIIGIKKDETFEHVLMFGLGGIYVDVLRNVSFRSIPISKKDSREMIKDTKIYELLYSTNKKPDIKFIQNVLIKVNKMVLENKNMEELDINPFIFNGRKGWAVDVRIIRGK